MKHLHLLPAEDEKWRLRAVIESPQGSRNKVMYEPTLDAFRITRSLPAGSSFPFYPGFIPRTKCEEGEPVHVLMLMDARAFPGCVVPITLLGAIEAEQPANRGPVVRNDRLIALAKGSPQQGTPRRLKDLDGQLVDQSERYVADYDRMRGTTFQALRRLGSRAGGRLPEPTRLG